MAFGVNSLLNMGLGALFSNQAHIQTTSNNIANVNTEGYSRQRVLQQDKPSVDYFPGQIGQGVETTQVVRYFNKFVESAYLDRSTMQSRYQAEYNLMRNIETLFNEADTPGISTALSSFFSSWNKLAQEPNNHAVRAALIEQVRTLSLSIKSVDQTLSKIQDEMDVRIQEDVNRANDLIKEIAELNREINIHTVTNRNNANQLMDLRDAKTRELANIMDIRVEDREAGDYTITTTSGNPLVQGDIPFSIEIRGPQVEKNLVHNSNYKGTLQFDGSDGYEYTVQVTKEGFVDATGSKPPPPGTAEYQVSLDGGKTWILDEATGKPKVFYATDPSNSIKVKNLDISFTDVGNKLSVGDKFVVSPKNDIYWISTTSTPLNISSQGYKDGTENTQRIFGGTLGAYLDVRDRKISEYRDRIAELTKTLTWEVNRIHSQGAGLEPINSALGTYKVERTNVPLGSPSSGFFWSDKLQSGNVSFAIYDPDTGKPLELNGAVRGFNIFSQNQNFDPSTHSLEDVVKAINDPANEISTYVEAKIVDNKLQLTAKEKSPGKVWGFGITADTSGLAAALGINTFFTGESPATFGVREELTTNQKLINAGRINGGAEGNKGDNITATEIAALSKKAVSIGGTNQTMTNYYAATVTTVGAQTQNMKFLNATETAMTNELKARKDEISGVSLDEEMSNLIKFQASYKAAAKLVTTADEMIQTLLSLKH